MIINKKDLGENWPFTVDEVEIKKGNYIFESVFIDFLIFLEYKNEKYAINGIAENWGHLPLEQSGIWSDDPEIPGAKKSITPLMEYLSNSL